MTTEELQRLVSGHDKSCGLAQSSEFSDPLERASVELARELISARRVVEAAKEANGEFARCPKTDARVSAWLGLRDALSAYEEAKG